MISLNQVIQVANEVVRESEATLSKPAMLILRAGFAKLLGKLVDMAVEKSAPPPYMMDGELEPHVGKENI